jgi:hypothetical protein
MTEQKQLAARLVAKNKTSVEIAQQCGVSGRTVFLWKADKQFQAEVTRVREQWRETVRNQGTADQDFRLRSLNDRHERLRRVIEERSQSPEFQNAAGGKTGLLTVTYKMQSIGDGESSAIPEYAVDTGLLAEMRAIEIQAATEMGQWKTRTEHEEKKVTTIDATPAAVLLAMILTPAQIDELEQKALALATAAQGA